MITFDLENLVHFKKWKIMEFCQSGKVGILVNCQPNLFKFLIDLPTEGSIAILSVIFNFKLIQKLTMLT